MKNTVLIYDSIESKQFIAEDYTSKKHSKIRSLSEINNTEYIEYKELYDNQTMEQISYILYGTPDYWDLLVTINNKDPLFDMCYEFDILEKIAENRVQTYLQDYSGTYKGDTYERLKDLMLDKTTHENEEKRSIKIIKPSKIYDFLTLYNALDI